MFVWGHNLYPPVVVIVIVIFSSSCCFLGGVLEMYTYCVLLWWFGKRGYCSS